MPGTLLRTFCALLLVIGVLTACRGHGAVSSSPTPKLTKVTEPTTADELDLVLDPSGVPYDAPVRDGVTVATRPLTTLDIAKGELRVMDGNELEVGPSEDGAAVRFSGTNHLVV